MDNLYLTVEQCFLKPFSSSVGCNANLCGFNQNSNKKRRNYSEKNSNIITFSSTYIAHFQCFRLAVLSYHPFPFFIL